MEGRRARVLGMVAVTLAAVAAPTHARQPGVKGRYLTVLGDLSTYRGGLYVLSQPR